MPQTTLAVRVQPRARADALVALRDGVLLVRVTAPPLDGRANKAVCRLLADTLRVPVSSLTVVRGLRARDKVVAVDGLDQATVDTAIGSALERGT